METFTQRGEITGEFSIGLTVKENRRFQDFFAASSLGFDVNGWIVGVIGENDPAFIIFQKFGINFL